MENPEEVLHCLEEFTKSKPSDIPRELEDYLCFVAKTGDPVYQWSIIKCLLREKMIRVITEFYEACPSVEIPPCPNVDLFNYDVMKTFILEKLDTFAAAPFTVQRLCELLTTPRKEYNRIDKYMRALEKNILVVSTTEPNGGRRNNTENGENIVNGLENDHLPPETSNSSNNDINVEEMDDTPPPPPSSSTSTTWSKISENDTQQNDHDQETIQETVVTESKTIECSSSTTTTTTTLQESVITCRNNNNEDKLVSGNTNNEPETNVREEEATENSDVSVTITAIPAGVQKRRNSIEPVVSSESEQVTESATTTTTLNEDSNDKIDDNTKKEIEETSTSIEDEEDEEPKDADSSSNIEIVNESNKIEETDTNEATKHDENDDKIVEKHENITAATCSKTIEEPSKEPCINDEITSSDKSINDDDAKLEKSSDNNVDSEVDNKHDRGDTDNNDDDEDDDDSKEVSSTPMDIDCNDDNSSGDKTDIVDTVETTTTESTL